MTDIREYLAHKPLLFDGGMGTYYKAAPGADCEMANLTDPEGVKKVHAEYLAAGAQAIKTNTFGLPRMAAAQMPGWEELAEAGWKLACDAAAEKDAAVFADLGPAPDTEAAPASSAYGLVAQQFAALGAKNFLFETLSSDVGIVEAVKALRVAVPDAFVMVSFAVLPDGYTREGLLFRDLLRRMEGSGVVDAVGLNCVSAPRRDEETGAGPWRDAAAPVGDAQRGLSGGHPGAGAVSGQARVFCPGRWGRSPLRASVFWAAAAVRRLPTSRPCVQSWTPCPSRPKPLRQRNFPPGLHRRWKKTTLSCGN